MSGNEGERVRDKRNLIPIILGAVAAYMATEKKTPSVVPETGSQPQARRRKILGKSNRWYRNRPIWKRTR